MSGNGMTTNEGNFHAWGQVQVTGAPTSSQIKSRGGVIARSAKGVYTFVPDVPINGADCTYFLTLKTPSLIGSIADTTDALKTISFLDTAGAAQDAIFDITILRTAFGTYE